jgi:pimeloyl-ACP methyl ester carboxylesterase
MWSCCALLVFVFVAVAQAQLSLKWSSCTALSSSKLQCQAPEANLPQSTFCTSTTTKYINDDPTSLNITLFIKRYQAEQTKKASIIVLGDIIVGNGGSSVEYTAIKLYNLMNKTFDVVLPDNRGTGKSTRLTCSGSTFFDGMVSSTCLNQYSSTYGANLTGFSVDEIAKDYIKLAYALKQESNTPIYLFGTSFGSYIAHRILQIDSSSIDAVIMDGVCAGSVCNATNWDIQRNTIAQTMLAKQYSSISQYYGDQNALSLFQRVLDRINRGVPVCGQPLAPTFTTTYARYSTYMFFDQSLRPALFSSALQLTRCQPNDFGDGIIYYRDYQLAPNPITSHFLCRLDAEPRLLDTHIVMSELIDWSTQARQSYLFNYGVDSLAMTLRDVWKRYPMSVYRNGIANYSKPILMLNGDIDPQAPLTLVRQFASNFNATLVVMPGMTSNSFMKSYTNGSTSTTCGMNLVSQFLSCPNCSIDTSCVQTMIGFTITGDALTSVLLGNVWANYPVPVTALKIGVSIVYGVILPLSVIVFILLLVFRKNRRITSRLFAPHIGQIYIFATQVINIIFYAGEYTSITYQQFASTVNNVLLVAACTVIFIQLERFYVLRKMYQIMNTENAGKVINLYKALSSMPLFLIIVSITILFWVIFGIIMSVTSEYFGYFTIYLPYSYCAIATAATLGLIAVLIFFIDLITNLNRKYFADDPLLFRVDSMLILPIIVFSIIGNVQVTSQLENNIIVNTVFNEIAVLLMIFFFGGNACIACILDVIRGRTLKVEHEKEIITDEDKIKDIISDDVCLKYFTEYCKAEFSLENLVGYMEVQKVAEKIESMSATEIDLSLSALNEKFMCRTSEMELNVISKLANSWKEMMKVPAEKAYNRKEVLQNLLEAIIVNLLDTFSRFLVTDKYLQCAETLKVKASMKTKTNMETVQQRDNINI